MSQNLSDLADFAKKWSDLTSTAVSEGISSQKISAVYDLDLQRLQTPGDYAMSDQEALQALRSVQQGAPTTAAPSAPFSIGSIPGYAVSDVQNLGVGLLGLVKKGFEDVIHPSDIAHQVEALWKDPAVLTDPLETLADPSDWLHPSRIVDSMAASPLLSSLLPGVYDAGILSKYGLKAGTEDLLEHPASSILDVLPIATKGAELAASVARTGLDDTAIEAARKVIGAAKSKGASKINGFSPFDTSQAALDARKAFRDAVPSGVRRAALYGQNGLGAAVIRTLMGVPFDDDTVGSFVTQWLGQKTGGNIGSESIAIGRAFTKVRRTVSHATAQLTKDVKDFWERNGITDPAEKDQFDQYLLHRGDQQWLNQAGITGDQLAKFQAAAAEYEPIAKDMLNQDLAAGKLATVQDPRTGALEVRALEGNDGRVVSASKRYDATQAAAKDVAGDLAKQMGLRSIGDPAPSVITWLDNMISPDRQTALARALFDDRVRNPKLLGTLNRLRDKLQKGDLEAARKLVLNLRAQLRSNYLRSKPEFRALAKDLDRATQTLKTYFDKRSVFNKAELAQGRLTTLMDRFPEARFMPRMQELIRENLNSHLAYTDAEPDDIDTLGQQIANGIYRGDKFQELVGTRELMHILNSSKKALIEERAAGLDPVWIPGVSPRDVARIGHPSLDFERITQSRSFKSRSLIAPAQIHDVGLGLIRRGADDLATKGLEEFFYGEGGLKAQWGVTEDKLIPLASQFAKGVSLEDTRASGSHVIDDWVAQNYHRINPREYMPGGGRLTGSGTPTADEFWVPSSVYKALQANLKVTAPASNFATKAYLRGTQIFRFSLLNFSPRYQAHIWFGGMFLGVVSEGPRIFDHVVPALGMAVQDSDWLMGLVKDKRFLAPMRPVIDWLKRRAELQGETGMNPAISHELAESNPDLINEYNYAGGSKVGKWLDQAMANRGLSAGVEMAALGANMWRAAAYLSGKASGGVEEGIRTALKVYADMDSYTPLERSIIRYAMPFYGWTRHILKFAMELPMDHPYRVAVLSRMVDQQWQDWPTGFPQALMYLFQIGDTDKAGNATAIDVRQLDPLRSVTSIFTLAGFLGSLNPLFQGLVAPAFGINPETAQPADLYPTMTLDQFYGGKTETSTNPLDILADGIGSYIPEAQVIDHFVGISAYTRWAKANDPSAYHNQLWQALNFPWTPQTINTYQVVAKSETTNYSLASDAVTAALQDPNPNDSTWTNLISEYPQVPYAGWLVQPYALRQYIFDQVTAAGYYNKSTGQATLPPNQVVVEPRAPKL